MWRYHFSEIDKELLTRLRSRGLDFEISNWKFTGSKTTHIYFLHGKRCFCYNCHGDGTISGNVYIATPVNNDPRGAVYVKGRPRSWGKRVAISKCGETDSERFDYIAELIAQVADSME